MNKFDKQHLTNLNAYSAQIDTMYRKAISQAAKMSIDIHGFNRDKPFTFADYPIQQNKADKLVEWLSAGVLGAIEKGAKNEWALSNLKNDATVKKLLKGWKDIPSKYTDPNNDALEAFLERKTAGLGLSDRVWQYTEKFQQEIELGLDLGIRAGRSAEEISRDIRVFLNHPAELYRRVKTEMVDSNGNPIWHLSKAARDYHPGQGVYRSSYKNAKRLAITETNMAYREADNERWQKLDFVIGQHVVRSKRHDTGGIVDICDELSGHDENDKRGRYPKDFKFTGWHPQCRCFAVPIMSDIEEMVKMKEAYIKGERYTPKNEQITEFPDSFVKWAEGNKEKIVASEKHGTLPYFLRDNRSFFDADMNLRPRQLSALEKAAKRHAERDDLEIMRIQTHWGWRQAHIAEKYGVDTTSLRKAIKATDIDAIRKEVEAVRKEIEVNSKLSPAMLKAKIRHAQRTPEEVETIKEAWAKRQHDIQLAQTTAKNILSVASEYMEVDATKLQELLSKGIGGKGLANIKTETKDVAMSILEQKKLEQALSDIIPNVHDWHKQFTITELQGVKTAVENKVQSITTNYTALDKQVQKLEWEANTFLGGNMNNVQQKYKTWQVSQAAYLKKSNEIKEQIEWNNIQSELNALKAYSTKSKPYFAMLMSAEDAVFKKDLQAAKNAIADAQKKKEALEKAQAKRNAKKPTTAVQFMPEDYTQTRKDGALWIKTRDVNGLYDRQTADKYFRPFAEKDWKRWSENEKDVAYLYTSGSSYINEPTYTKYYGTKYGLHGEKRDSWTDINTLTDMIDKSTPFSRDVWLNRGASDGEFLGQFGLRLSDYTNDPSKLIGQIGEQKPFMSTGHSKSWGFVDSGDEATAKVVYNIYCPKGTKGIYTEPYSAFGTGGRRWNGKDVTELKNECEVILQRGSIIRVTKAEYKDGQWFFDMELVAQPKKMPNKP